MEAIKLNLVPSDLTKPICHASQFDDGREIMLLLMDGQKPYILSDEEIELDVKKLDGNIVTTDLEVVSGKNYVIMKTTEQMCAIAGKNNCELKVQKDGNTIYSKNFYLAVEESATAGGIESESEINNLETQIAGLVEDAVENQYDSENVIFDSEPTEGHGTGYTVSSAGIKAAIDAAGGNVIDDTQASANKTYSSNKINAVVSALIDDTQASASKAYSSNKVEGKITPLNNALGDNISLVGNPITFTDDAEHNATASVEGATQIVNYGKQMFYANAWGSIASVSNGVITFDGTIQTSSANNVVSTPYLPKGKYTVKIEAMDAETKYCRFQLRAANGTVISDTNAYVALPFTVTMNPTQDIYKMSAVAKHATTDSYNTGSIRITINRGESVGDYEAFNGGIYAVGDTIKTLVGSNYLVADTANDITLTYQKLIMVSALEDRISQNEVDIAEINSKDIVKFNNDVLSDVNACSSYGLTALGTNLPLHTLSMLFMTDIHSHDFEEVKNAVKYLNAIDSVDIGVCLGDIAPSKYTDNANGFIEAVQGSNKPFYTIYGNHDIGNNKSLTDSTTVANAFNKWVKPATTIDGLTLPYYKADFADYKLTAIFLNNYDVPDTVVDGAYKVSRGAEVVSQTQVDWLLGVLDNVPTDYTVVIFRHSFPDSSTRIDCNFSMYASALQGNGVACYTDLIPDIVNAWKNGTALSKTYSPNIADVSESITINHDFTSRGSGKFACYVVGHSHRDIVAKSTTYNDQIVIGFEASSYTNYINNGGDLPRVANEKSQDAITVLSVDASTKLIKMVRVGSNKTVRMVDRTSIAIAYT